HLGAADELLAVAVSHAGGDAAGPLLDEAYGQLHAPGTSAYGLLRKVHVVEEVKIDQLGAVPLIKDLAVEVVALLGLHLPQDDVVFRLVFLAENNIVDSRHKDRDDEYARVVWIRAEIPAELDRE